MCKECEKTNTMCDNDCETYICLKCGEMWYFADKVKKLGHNPKCGMDFDRFSDEDVIFTKEEEEQRLFESEDYESCSESFKNNDPIQDLSSTESDS